MSVEITVDDKASSKIAALIEACGKEGRAHLHQVAANALANLIQRHIAYYAARKHTTARELGAQITGHYEKGSAAITSHGDAESGTVSIPIPGIQRAWSDLDITPSNANRLTIPISSKSYGHRVAELGALGWKFFQGKKGHEAEDILFGYKGNGKDKEVDAMYVLKTYIHQPKDPTLLPSKEELGKTAAESSVREVMRIIRKARSAA